MLLSIYILFVIMAFATMILSLLRTKYAMFELWGLLSMVLFFILGVVSFNIESYTCALTSGDVWSCYQLIMPSPELGTLFNGLGLLMFVLTIVTLFFRIRLSPDKSDE